MVSSSRPPGPELSADAARRLLRPVTDRVQDDRLDKRLGVVGEAALPLRDAAGRPQRDAVRDPLGRTDPGVVDDLGGEDPVDALLRARPRPPEHLEGLAADGRRDPPASPVRYLAEVEDVERRGDLCDGRELVAEEHHLHVRRIVGHASRDGAGEEHLVDPGWERVQDALRERAQLRASGRRGQRSTSTASASHTPARTMFGPLGASRTVSS
jgi:hypothetical protein